MSSLNGRPLNIIMEEDESSPCSSVKARRRHANIRLDNTFLCPRPAPRPSPARRSPESSPDSFTFRELSKFPCPPSASPAHSASELSSSPGALTPSTSDDEFSLPSPRFNPRRAAMSIQKSYETSSSFLRLSKGSSIYDSEPESDWEWYNREMSKLISLPSPDINASSSRPESLFIDSQPPRLRRVSTARRDSRDTIYPRRNSKTRSSIMIPKYPPPPVPSIPAILLTPSPTTTTTSSSRSPSPYTMPPRPPPRSSLPLDVFDLYMDNGTEGDAESDDASSAFSFSMYEIDFGERAETIERPLPPTPGSAFFRSSFVIDAQEQELELDERFQLDDYQLQLPLSLPGTPLDLESDIAMGLEKLREEETCARVDVPLTANSDSSHDSSMPQELLNRLYTPTISSFSFSPSPSPCPSPSPIPIPSEDRALKSKWSTSTLGSIHEEHGRRSASSKLKLYFSGGYSGKGSAGYSKNNNSSPSKVIPHTPASTTTSPFGLKTPSRKVTKAVNNTPTCSPSRYPQSPHKRTHRPSSSQTTNSDVLVIGYGTMNGTGLKRRGSTTTVVSDVGSEDSVSSSSSAGLRRKPIPIEMFLRGAV